MTLNLYGLYRPVGERRTILPRLLLVPHTLAARRTLLATCSSLWDHCAKVLCFLRRRLCMSIQPCAPWATLGVSRRFVPSTLIGSWFRSIRDGRRLCFPLRGRCCAELLRRSARVKRNSRITRISVLAFWGDPCWRHGREW